MTNGDLPQQLLDQLADFDNAHRTAETAYHQFAACDAELAEIKATLMEQIVHETDHTGKPRFSNDDKRKAELQRRLLSQYGPLLIIHGNLDHHRRSTQADLERQAERLRTYRALLVYQTAQTELAAARLMSTHLIETGELQ